MTSTTGSAGVLFLLWCFVRACNFPDYLQTLGESQPWQTQIKHNRTKTVKIYFRHGVMEILPSIKTGEPVSERWNCTMEFKGNYLLHLESNQQPLRFVCIKVYKRNRSILQIAWSKFSYTLDPTICENEPLTLDPWPLVAYHLLEQDFMPCPFSGGFDIKITDSKGRPNPCNYMDLPMRMESDCIGGEGMIFNFRANNCRPKVSMRVRERTLCVASWKDDTNYFAVIRRHSSKRLWCVRFPVREKRNEPAYFFNDLSCVSTDLQNETIDYFRLDLEISVVNNLCQDEYEECAEMPCNMYTEQECQKTCKLCSLSNPPAICSYPRRFRGIWYQRDTSGVKYIEFHESDLIIENVGNFSCVAFDDSPPRRERTYTVVSMFKNGCRPRYSCIRLKRLGPSVLKYSLSKSYIWPMNAENQGAKICEANRFAADPDPVADRYRSYRGTGKPIVMHYPSPKWIDCNLTTSYTIRASFANGNSCMGSIYQVCGENSRLRIDFTNCSHEPLQNEYGCVAQYEGHYWETLLLLQNVADDTDTRCIMFNQLHPSDALVLVGGYCDKNSWGFVRGGLRTPLMKLHIRPDIFPCKNLPLAERTMKSTTSTLVKPYDDARVPVTVYVSSGDSDQRDSWNTHNIPNTREAYEPDKNIRQVNSHPSSALTVYSNYTSLSIMLTFITRFVLLMCIH